MLEYLLQGSPSALLQATPVGCRRRTACVRLCTAARQRESGAELPPPPRPGPRKISRFAGSSKMTCCRGPLLGAAEARLGVAAGGDNRLKASRGGPLPSTGSSNYGGFPCEFRARRGLLRPLSFVIFNAIDLEARGKLHNSCVSEFACLFFRCPSGAARRERINNTRYTHSKLA